MRLLFFIVSFSPFFISNSWGQSYNQSCGISHTEQLTLLEGLKENRKFWNKNKDQLKKLETIYVPLKVHLIANSAGEGRLDFSFLIKEMTDINKQFDGFVFYLKDLEVNNINHTPAFETPTGGSGVGRIVNQKTTVGQNAVNLFVPQNADTGSGNVGTTLGFYTPSGDYLVVRKSQIGQGNITLAHELGHFFDLPHTFFGWEGNAWTEEKDGLTVTRQFANNRPVELVDRSNCAVAGDAICDTQPDYNFGNFWFDDCRPFGPEVKDRNGDLIDVPQTNFMTYFQGCEGVFSDDQYSLMTSDYMSSSRSDIRSSYIPDTASIVGEVALLAPSFNQTIEYYDDAEISWTAVGNAQKYYVNIRAAGDDRIIHTTSTSLRFEDLLPNKVYTWSVHPYTETGGGAEAKSSIFRTSGISSSTIDPDFANSINIYPNPVLNGAPITLEFNSDQDLDATMKLVDFNGKILLTESHKIVQGENQFRISSENLPVGLYIINLSTQKGELSRELIITK